MDVGCRHNWFQQFYPSVWGVDPSHDQHRDDQLTPEWWIPNWGQWPRAISINAMHFCDQGQLAGQIAKVRGLLSPGGRAVVALNRHQIQKRTTQYSAPNLEQMLQATPGLTRMVWLDQPRVSLMDGNVWLWLSA